MVAAGPYSAEFELDANVRSEVKEETGLVGRIENVGLTVVRKLGSKDWSAKTYLVRTDEGEVTLNKEHTEFKWIKLEDLDNLDTTDDTKQAIKQSSNSLGIYKW